MNINLPQPQYFSITWPAPFIAHVEINRPQKLNAFIAPMWDEMRLIFGSLSHNPDVRCILLSGAGDRAFTAGLDVEQASKGDSPLTVRIPDPSRRATHLRRHIHELQDAITSVARCEKPVIALMHGYAIGAAIDLSSACDIRLCTTDVRFCVKEVDIGLAADVGTLSRLPKVVGGVTSWVKDVCMTARTFSADEAVQNNFVSKAIPGGKQELINEGLKLAQLLSSKSPVAVQGTKNILDAAWGRTVEDNLNYTAVWNAAMLQSSDVERAMMSGLQKRTPTFEKL